MAESGVLAGADDVLDASVDAVGGVDVGVVGDYLKDKSTKKNF
jgi:hypothetical protein